MRPSVLMLLTKMETLKGEKSIVCLVFFLKIFISCAGGSTVNKLVSCKHQLITYNMIN